MRDVTLDILGSCISRLILLNGNYEGTGVESENIKLQYFFDKNNIVSCMMPAPFSREDIDSIQPEELYSAGRIKSLKQGINKDTLPMIMKGKADYLIIDVHDLTLDVSAYENTTFSNCAYEFYNTELYKKNADKIANINFMNISECLWYPYIDLFFNEILQKFDSNHIILNRFHACKNYIDKEGNIREIPGSFKRPFHGNYKYNAQVRKLENYIIDKYNPYVLDLTKYFITDGMFWDNLNGVHYQNMFYEEALIQLEDILFNENSERVHDKISSLVTADILNNDLADDEEFIKYLKEIENPFVSCEVLDDVCEFLTYKEVARNRKLLAELYKNAYTFAEYMNRKDILEKDKAEFLIKKLPADYHQKYKELSAFVKNFYKQDKSEAVSYLEEIFLNMINEGDMQWVNFLEKIEKYSPQDIRILGYRLQYFQAVNNIKVSLVKNLKIFNQLMMLCEKM